MKKIFSLLALTLFTGVISLSQSGCAGTYVSGPGPVYYGPSYPVSAWGGAGFYGGSTFYRSGWRGNAPVWNAGTGSWNNRSGSWHGSRGGSASWGGGSGSAQGWRGGSASWGGGSGSWHGPRGGGGSWHR